MRKRREPEIELKTAGQLAAMRAAGLVVADALRAAAEAAGPGVSPADLDEMAERRHPGRRGGAVVPRATTATRRRSAPR